MIRSRAEPNAKTEKANSHQMDQGGDDIRGRVSRAGDLRAKGLRGQSRDDGFEEGTVG